MNNTRILIVILLLISVLFIVGLNLGALHADDQVFQMPGWASGLGKILVGSQSLQFADLRATPAQCLQRGKLSIAAGNTCTFAIRQSLFAQRAVKLQLVAGTSVTVVLNQEEMLPVQQSLAGTGTTTTADMKVYPGKTHGMLSVTCQATPEAGETAACLLMIT